MAKSKETPKKPRKVYKMINPAYKLTFGVELEMIFVFHESLLVGQLQSDQFKDPLMNGHLIQGRLLDRYVDEYIVKDLDLLQRETLCQGAEPYQLRNPYYLGWGLRNSWDGIYEFVESQKPGLKVTEYGEHKEIVRTYYKEVLEIAKEVIRYEDATGYWTNREIDEGSQIDIYDGTDENKPTDGFDHWHLTNDFSLIGLTRPVPKWEEQEHAIPGSAFRYVTLEPPSNELEDTSQLQDYLHRYKICRRRDGSAPSPFSHGLAMTMLASPMVEPTTYGLLKSRFTAFDLEIDTVPAQQQSQPLLTTKDNGYSALPLDSATQLAQQENQMEFESRVGHKLHLGPLIRRRCKRRFEERFREPDEPNPIPKTKRSRLGKKQDGLPDVARWDSHGIELVSRVLRPIEEDFEEIKNMCEKLKGGQCDEHGATTTDRCGLHVHIKPDGDDFDLLTLQHLAYILVMYEKHIDTLQPKWRRVIQNPPTNFLAAFDFCSNSLNFSLSSDPEQKHCAIDTLAFDRNKGEWRTIQRLDDLAALRDVREVIGTTGNVERLSELMCPNGANGKGCAVNFENLKRGRQNQALGPRTIEFRQHDGCLNGRMIKYWTIFCMGLVRLANHMAHYLRDTDGNPVTKFDDQCLYYPWTEWNDGMSIEDLYTMMRLPTPARAYFRRRAAYNAFRVPSDDDGANFEYLSTIGHHHSPQPPSFSDLTGQRSDDDPQPDQGSNPPASSTANESLLPTQSTNPGPPPRRSIPPTTPPNRARSFHTPHTPREIAKTSLLHRQPTTSEAHQPHIDLQPSKTHLPTTTTTTHTKRESTIPTSKQATIPTQRRVSGLRDYHPEMYPPSTETSTGTSTTTDTESGVESGADIGGTSYSAPTPGPAPVANMVAVDHPLWSTIMTTTGKTVEKAVEKAKARSQARTRIQTEKQRLHWKGGLLPETEDVRG